MSFTRRLLGLPGDTRAAAVADTARPPQVGTASTSYTSPGMPQFQEWDGTTALRQGYLGSIHVHRVLNKKARDISRLPFRVGADPDRPADWRTDHPLARLLGPPPGGPNGRTAARALLAWSIVQRYATGRMAWEIVRDSTGRPANLWPLVSAILQPIPTVPAGQRARIAGLNPTLPVGAGQPGDWWAGFEYQLATGYITLRPDQVFYSWRPSALDWRQAESALQAAALPIAIAREFDRYNWQLLRNDLAARKLIITPGFDEDDERRAWQDQFLSELTGVDNAGRVAFAEYATDETMATDAQGRPIPPIQVHDLGQSSVDSQLIEMVREAKRDIYKGLGMPESIAGDSSERTFSNADAEHRNYWEELRSDAAEVADDINTFLAPQFGGSDVGWFDFSDVAALRPARRFIDVNPIEATSAGMMAAEEWRDDVGLAGDAPGVPDTAVKPAPLAAVRSVATAGDVGARVLGYLTKSYPRRVLGWVTEADWHYDDAVPLDEIRMARRPGARDPAKVAAIADAIRAGRPMDPIVLVDTGEDRLEIADGYHRTLAFLKAGRRTIPAYIGSGAGQHGPWETAMHAAKLNRSTAESQRYDTSPLGSGENWVSKVGGLPLFIRAIAHALIRSGHSESRAIEMAVGIVKNWASGQGNVTAKTRAKAAAAVAEWEAKKAASHARDDAAPMLQTGTAGSLLPVAAHIYVPGPGRRCKDCGRRASADIHVHAVRPTDRSAAAVRSPMLDRTQAWRAVDDDARALEPQLEQALRDLFAQQAASTLSRLDGRRGAQMLRAAPQPDDMDATSIFDPVHWAARTAQAVQPIYTALVALTGRRLGQRLGVPATRVAPVDAARTALAQRVTALADTVTRTTYDAITAALRDGRLAGEGMGELAARVRQVFDEATGARSQTIARTEVIGGINQAQQAYAEHLPPGLVAYKEWLATPDARTRESHRHASGQRRLVGDPFTVGGVRMSAPGDPAAPPEQTINCRCTTVYVPGRQVPALTAAPLATVA